MTSEPDLAQRVRSALAGAGSIAEIKMFGGVGFMLNGNMVAAASAKRGLLLRVGKDAQDQALARPGTRPMEMKGRRLDGYLYVDPAVLDDVAFRDWLRLAVSFVASLPAKPLKSKSNPAKTKRK
jgi:TfoX/Sxy family transcriptional regulator of competence genes